MFKMWFQNKYQQIMMILGSFFSMLKKYFFSSIKTVNVYRASFAYFLWQLNRFLFKKIEVHAVRVIGKSHEAQGIPCQDAFLIKKGWGFVFSAVADGHGSAKRSDIGSDYAVKIAFTVFNEIRNMKYGFKTSKKTLRKMLRTIEDRWRESVKKHYIENEGKVINDDNQEKIVDSYGTTLLLSIFIKNTMILMQLGDGDIMVIDEKGRCAMPMPVSVRSVANSTESLCEYGAYKNFRLVIQHFALFEKMPLAVMMSTDGYANSFESLNDFTQVGTDIVNIIQEDGFSQIEDDLESWLKHASTIGSGDDITCSFTYVGGVEIWS